MDGLEETLLTIEHFGGEAEKLEKQLYDAIDEILVIENKIWEANRKDGNGVDEMMKDLDEQSNLLLEATEEQPGGGGALTFARGGLSIDHSGNIAQLKKDIAELKA